MSTIVIADCGSTKIHWAVLSGGNCIYEFHSSGINPVVMSPEAIAAQFESELAGRFPADVARVEFYGAGCKGDAHCNAVRNALAPLAPAAEIIVESDMLGACRALLDETSGVVCILGTGANSCLYNGREIVENVSPGGYILGDEGSGAWLGRRLAGDLIKGIIPEELATDFKKEYGLDTTAIIRHVYRPLQFEMPPNRFLASFAPFLSERINHPYVKEIVKEGFNSFLTRNVAFYFRGARQRGSLTINFVGSVACAFSPILKETVDENGYVIGKIIRTPLESLVKNVIAKNC